MSYSFSVQNQSPWLVDIYNQYLPYKTDGFLVEIGVGHQIEGADHYLPVYLEKFKRVMSNTADLLDLGWSGIYIDPVKEYCDEAAISQKHNLDRLKIINVAVSDCEEELKLYLGDSFIPNNYEQRGYDWIFRIFKTEITANILRNANCPKNIDLMSIDVEGFEDRVIKGIDFNQHTPKVLVVEIDKVPKDYVHSLLSDYYRFIRDDGLNGVWVAH